tara:strand:- start:8381 stop:9355 length:975 start_codon:yes stop_codon:yes gene_type:complete
MFNINDTISIIFAIAPIFVVVIFGYYLRKIGKVPKEFWDNSNFLIFWVFLPSLLFVKISNVDIELDLFLDFILILALIFIFTLLYAVFSLKTFNITSSDLLPTIQSSCRINTVIVLAISYSLYGTRGLEIAVIGSAVMVTIINIFMPFFLLFALRGNKINIFQTLKRDIIFSPIILSMLLGFVFNYYNIKNIPILHPSLSILSDAALPIMLLSLGASLKIKEIKTQATPIIISSVGKLILTPIATIILCFVLSVPKELAEISIIYAAVPTGVIVYSLVKRAKGNESLASAIVSTQILLSFITMPIFIMLMNNIILFLQEYNAIS